MNNLEKIVIASASSELLLSKYMWKLNVQTVNVEFANRKYTVFRNQVGSIDVYENCATQNSLPLNYRRKILNQEKELIIEFLLSD